jgi:hypothetical protein
MKYAYAYPPLLTGGLAGNLPLSVPDLGLWLKADAGVTLVGGAVDAWADQSGNGRDFSAPGATNRPAFSGTLNGLPVLTFDGSTDYLTGNAASLTIAQNVPGITMIAVVKYATGGTDQRLYSVSTGASSVLVRSLMRTVTSSYGVSARRMDAVAAVDVTGGTIGADYVIQSGLLRYSVATAGIFVNGASLVEAPLLTPGNTENTVSLNSAIGVALSLTGQFLNGDLAELIVYQRAISDEERNSVELYLSQKWGIAI